MHDVRHWATQSTVSDPGKYQEAFDGLPSDLVGLHESANQLVFHYRADGNWAANGIDADRISEIDTRYVEAMLGRLLELGEPSLQRPRPAAERIVGCCRDFTLLFVAMARHKGVPARARVGFASYFEAGWHLDHVVAEIWDERRERWRLVDPELKVGHKAPDGVVIDPLNVPHDRFLTAPRAWLELRAGVGDAERFVVAPDLDIPDTRGWPYLRHNLIHDLATWNKTEMLLWDGWGLIEAPEPLDAGHAETLDHLARLISDRGCPVENMQDWARRPEFRLPAVVTSYSPASPIPLQVDVSRIADGA
jgi:hypothetical protein